METRKLDLPGVVVDVVIRRNYPYKNFASHLIGYLGEISQDELEEKSSPGTNSATWWGNTESSRCTRWTSWGKTAGGRSK